MTMSIGQHAITTRTLYERVLSALSTAPLKPTASKCHISPQTLRTWKRFGLQVSPRRENLISVAKALDLVILDRRRRDPLVALK